MLSLPAVESISLEPILFKQVPNFDTLLAKLNEFIDSAPSWTSPVTQAQVKQALAKTVIPFLKASSATPSPPQPPTTPFNSWSALAASLVSNLPISNLFPLVDIWRIALLNPKFSEWSSTKGASKNTISLLLSKTLESKGAPRNYQLTVIRMLSNAFSNTNLARECVVSMRNNLTSLLVSALLHEDVAVRTAAASLAFNVIGYLQKLRLEKMKTRHNGVDPEEDAEWEVEIVSAILEVIKQENTSGDLGKSSLFRDLWCDLRDSPSSGGLAGFASAFLAVYGASDAIDGSAAVSPYLDCEINGRGWNHQGRGPQPNFRGCRETLSTVDAKYGSFFVLQCVFYIRRSIERMRNHKLLL